MSGKKFLLILGALAVVSLGVSTVLSLLLGGRGAAGTGQGARAGKPLSKSEALLAQLAAAGEPKRLLPTQSQLEETVRDLRARIAEYEHKRQLLDERDKRVAQAEENLKRRAKEVEKLRMELIGPLTRLKDAVADLQRQQKVVAKQEKANFQRIAATFEKMETTKGGAMLAGMCENGQTDDVVKILYYMNERSSAKLLAEIPDQALAAKLTGLMKKIQEEG
jgi:flagellar motility protein MotE (MotC chaperone)